jgi:hypothetical protein
MKSKERFRKPQGVMAAAFACREADAYNPGGHQIRGDVFFRLYDGPEVRPDKLYEERTLRNLVVLDASILIARLMKDNQEPPQGIYALAVGTGDVGWDLQSPPAATNTQRALYSEITRKTFSNTQFIDSGGAPTAIPTNVVDFTTIFTESEAVGPLVEMGLIGGNISTNLAVQNPVSPPNGPYDPLVDLTQFETMVNYLTFAVINKPATSTMEIVWRLTT